MKDCARPIQVIVFSLLPVLAGAVTLVLGLDARAYLAPGFTLLQAGLMWTGTGGKMVGALT